MNGSEICQTLGISRDQRRRLVRLGHLQRRRVDEQGNPCRHEETLEPCSCSWDYPVAAVRSLGRLGTIDGLSVGARARPLPKKFRFDPGTPHEEIEADLAQRRKRRVGSRRSTFLPTDIDEKLAADEDGGLMPGWLLLAGVAVAGVLIAGIAWTHRTAGPGGTAL